MNYRWFADGPVTFDGDGDGHEDGGRQRDAGHRIEESEDENIFNSNI